MSNYMRSRKTLSSVADAYREMYATPNEDILNEELIDSLIEDVRDEEINDWLDYLEEDGMMSVPMKNKKKIQQALISKYAKKHPKVKITFGTQSKGKFVDDNNVNFKGNDKDIDNLMKDIQKDKPLMKMMEDNDLDESKGLAAKAKKSGISVGTLRKVYNRGMAAWKTGHRPGTTPQQWGMARVNAFIVKKKKGNLNHDKDLAHVIHPDDSMLDEAHSKYDANILKSVADTYASMQNYGLQGDIVEDLQEGQTYKSIIQGLEKDKKEVAKKSKAFRQNDTKYIDKAIKFLKMLEKEGIPAGQISQVDFVTNRVPKFFIGPANKSPSLSKFTPNDVKKAVAHAKKLGIIKESTELQEVKRQEVDAMKKVSKDMQKVLVSYQKIANMGDKELKNTVHNKDYKKVLDARDTILKMIGTLNTKMLMQKEDFELVEASAGEMIDKLFKTGGDKMMQYGIAKLLNMTGVGVALEMQKQNPVGFKNTMVAMGKDNKIKMAPNNPLAKRLAKMFKQLGVKPLPEELDNDDKPVVKKIINKLKGASKKHAKQASDLEKAVNEGKGKNFAQQAAIAIAKKKSGKYDKDGKKIDERVKDGKLDPLSKMGKSKLTGQEINKYYRDNPKQKAAARDKTVKKAIELALDLSGATNYAIKEIEKLKRGLSKNPAVKLALRHANESKEFTGHHVVIENLSPANVVKLKTFGKMMAKMTKLPFDEKDPEKSIDKLMGQIWKQKHSPSNWERLHKMVAMLRDIGVKMPSLKGKYMGLDPVSKKAIFYKEGTDEMVEWHEQIDENKDVRKKYRGKEQKSVDKLIMQKGIDKVQKHHDKNPREFDKMVKNLAMMEDVQEGIEELVEKKEMSAADIKKIAQMTDRNDHTGSLMHLAKLLGDRKGLDALKGIMMTHKALGHMPDGLMRTRNQIYDNLMRQSSSKYSNHKDVIRQF